MKKILLALILLLFNCAEFSTSPGTLPATEPPRCSDAAGAPGPKLIGYTICGRTDNWTNFPCAICTDINSNQLLLNDSRCIDDTIGKVSGTDPYIICVVDCLDPYCR